MTPADVTFVDGAVEARRTCAHVGARWPLPSPRVVDEQARVDRVIAARAPSPVTPIVQGALDGRAGEAERCRPSCRRPASRGASSTWPTPVAAPRCRGETHDLGDAVPRGRARRRRPCRPCRRRPWGPEALRAGRRRCRPWRPSGRRRPARPVSPLSPFGPMPPSMPLSPLSPFSPLTAAAPSAPRLGPPRPVGAGRARRAGGALGARRTRDAVDAVDAVRAVLRHRRDHLLHVRRETVERDRALGDVRGVDEAGGLGGAAGDGDECRQRAGNCDLGPHWSNPFRVFVLAGPSHALRQAGADRPGRRIWHERGHFGDGYSLTARTPSDPGRVGSRKPPIGGFEHSTGAIHAGFAGSREAAGS